MQRSIVRVCTVACLGVAAACSDNQSAPTAPSVPLASDATANAASALSCPSPASTIRQIFQLFPKPQQQILVSLDFAIIVDLERVGKVSQAQTAMFKLWNYTLQQFYAGDLNVTPTSAGGPAMVLAFGRALYCTVGLDGSHLALGSGPNDVSTVVFPSSSTQTVTTTDNSGGVQVPGGALKTPVTITISALPATPPPLKTSLDQFPPFFSVTVVPAGTQVLASALNVEFCVSVDPSIAPALHLAHNVPGPAIPADSIIEILPLLTATQNFLQNCGTSGSAQGESPLQLARDGHFARAAERLGQLASDLVTPEDAQAATGGVPVKIGIGGKTSSFSPFGAVDTALTIRTVPSPFPAQSAPVGSSVTTPPAVQVVTRTAGTVIDSAQVTFAAQSPGDLIAIGSTTQTQTVVVPRTLSTTAPAGVAAVAAWILGPGTNTVNASAVYPSSGLGQPPILSTGVGVTVLPAPVPLFSATGTTTVSGYGSGGYDYVLDNPVPPEQYPFSASDSVDGSSHYFASPSYVFGPDWVTGVSNAGVLAPFASPNAQALQPSCTLEFAPNVDQVWNNNPSGNSLFLLRKSFVLPNALQGSVQVGVAVDNDIRVFVDGTEITTSGSTAAIGGGGSPAPFTSPFVTHDGCPQQDSYFFSIPASSLAQTANGTHLLAIEAQDRGSTAYVDARVFATGQ